MSWIKTLRRAMKKIKTIKELKVDEDFLRFELAPIEFILEKYPLKEVEKYLLSFFTPEEKEKIDYLKTHLLRFIELINFVGTGEPSMKLLDIGTCEFTMLLLKKYTNYQVYGTHYGELNSSHKVSLTNFSTGEIFTYETIGVNIEKDIFPFEDNFFDVVVMSEVLEHLAMDPMHAISEINRILRWGGKFILTTPNIVRLKAVEAVLNGWSPYLYGVYIKNQSTDRHNREYTPMEVKWLLEAGGFKVEKLYTKFVWSNPNLQILELLKGLNYPSTLRGDCIFALGIKISEVKNRYPEFLYE